MFREWYQDDHIGGFLNPDGTIDVCEEYGLTDADTDSHAVDVLNGYGYYDDTGHYRSFGRGYDYDF